MFRRVLAFLIDIYVAALGMLPLIALPILFIEFLSTGDWVWSFRRGYFRTSDIILFPLCVFGVVGMVYYWIWHSKNNRQTFAQRLLKFE